MYQVDPAFFPQKGDVLEKPTPMKREVFSHSSPSAFRLQEDKERKGADMKGCQQDIFQSKNWPNPVQGRHNSATARRKIYSEEKQNLSLGRPEMDTIFPPKPGCHRMAFNQSNCQADSDYFIQKDKKSFDCLKDHFENGKQTSNRRQEKQNDRRKLKHFDSDSNDLSQERGETNRKSLNGYHILHKNQRRLYENEIWLAKEIHKKEILLQEKLLKAAETVKKVQLQTVSEDKVKSKEQRSRGKAENRLYYTEKGNWDWESARDRALGGRRHEGQGDGFSNWVRNGFEKVENGGQKEKRREKIEWENRGRTTKAVEKEWDHFEEMTRHKARAEKDRKRRERVMELEEKEMREWDQSDWQEKKMVKDGEKRRYERAKLKQDIELDDEDQQWSLMSKFASNSHFKEKAVSKHDKTNVQIVDHLAIQERVHQYNNRLVEEIPLKNPVPEPGLNTHDGKRLQQVQLGPESSPDTDVQLVPCKVCNRCFKENRLAKHISICQKTQKPRRHVFDSSQHRAKGTELEEFLKTNGRSKSPEVRLHCLKSTSHCYYMQTNCCKISMIFIRRPDTKAFDDYRLVLAHVII